MDCKAKDERGLTADRMSKAGLEAQQNEARHLAWYPPQEELVAYQALLKVGKAYARKDVAAAVEGMELCHRILHRIKMPPQAVPFGFCVFGVVAIRTESRLAHGQVRACEGCGVHCEKRRGRPCKRFTSKIRAPEFEELISAMEALIGTFGIKRRHIDSICQLASEQDVYFAKWHTKEYLGNGQTTNL